MARWLEAYWERVWQDYVDRFSVAQWSAFTHHVVDTLLILFAAIAANWLAYELLMRLSLRRRLLKKMAHRRKVETVTSLVYSTLKYVIYIVMALWILTRWGVDTQSLVVGSAVLGAAFGFGSQGLVQDLINGLSLLAEDQLRIGDFVEAGGKTGAVEEIGLRVVKLRDHLGTQHVIFNRNISLVSNFTAGAAPAQVDIWLASRADAARAQALAEQVCRDMEHELPFFPGVPRVSSIEESPTGGLFLRVHVHVMPQRETAVQEFFVERVKQAFAAAGLEIPGGRVRVVMVSDAFRHALASGHDASQRAERAVAKAAPGPSPGAAKESPNSSLSAP